MTNQLLGVLTGGAIALVSALLSALVSGFFLARAAERRARDEWRRKARLEVATQVVRALQAFNREIVNLAISDRLGVDGAGPDWDRFYAATTDWNVARHEAALISTSAEVEALAALDRELDDVLEAAGTRRWAADDFRLARARLGELGSRYIGVARSAASEGDARGTSLWEWSNEISRPRVTSTALDADGAS